jgi:trans-2,3-dihydro-3-hydroxyanthranilate isomerase
VRIFTPADELPFAGHPLVGTAWVMMHLGPGGISTLRCGIGDVGVRREDDVVWVDAPMPADAVTDVADDLATRAGLPPPVSQCDVAMPLSYRVMEYRSAAEVAAAEPDMGVLAETFGTYLYARDGDQVRARFFAPQSAVAEDPATGSAAVALAAALSARGEGHGAVTIEQGEEMGHPSRIHLVWDTTTASIGGTVRHDEVRVLEA